MSKSDTGKKIAIGAAVAGAVGYLAGLLTAPKSGKETRADIKNTANKTVLELEKQLKKLNSELAELVDKGLALAKEQGDKAKAGLNKAVEQAKESQQKVREVISALKSGETDEPELKKAVAEAKKSKEHLAQFLKN